MIPRLTGGGLREVGRVTAIHVAAERGGPPVPLGVVRAVRGRGLEGDRYYDHTRKLSRDPRKAVGVTLIAQEALEALEWETGVPLTAAESRRNLATLGVDLGELVGRQFRVGGAVLRGLLPCEPCLRLERLTGRRLIRGLRGRGGLRAIIVGTGAIAVGDSVLVQPVAGEEAAGLRTVHGSDPP